MQIHQPQNLPQSTDEFWIWLALPAAIIFTIIAGICFYIAYLEAKATKEYEKPDEI